MVNMATASKLELEVVLLGKTGNGKSATGNAILGDKVFKAKAHHESVTKTVSAEVRERGRHIIRVVDTPGLADTGLTLMKDKEITVENMANVFIKCSSGVHVFALVVRQDARLTQEERDVFTCLKSVFGDRYLKDHGMVIITHGDAFEDMLEEDGQDITFERWLRQGERGPLGELFEECDYRCILFDNKVKDSKSINAQFDAFIKVAEELRKKNVYTNEHFQRFEQKRREMIDRYQAPYLKRSIQLRIDLLMVAACDLENSCEQIDIVKEVENKAQDLLKIVEEAKDIRLREIEGDLKQISGACKDVLEKKGKMTNEKIKTMCMSLEKYKLPPIGYTQAFMKYGITEVWSYLLGASDLHIS